MSKAQLTPRRLFGGVAVTLALLVPVITQAARPVDPPSVEMTRGENNIVAATVLDTPGPTRVRVRVERLVHGEGDGELVLRTADEQAVASLKSGQTYLFAFTRLASDDQFRDAKFIDPEGPSILRLRGLRSAAIFENSAALRFLFARARGEDQPSDAERLDAIFATMASDDERTRAFAIEELFLREELGPSVNEQQAALAAKLMRSPKVTVQLRQFLHVAAATFPGGLEQQWLVDADRAVLRENTLVLDLTTPRPLLVLTAIEQLGEVGAAEDVALLTPWLASNSPAVVEAALDAVDRVDPAAALAAVEARMAATLLDDSVHADTRRLLERYYVEHQPDLLSAGDDTL